MRARDLTVQGVGQETAPPERQPQGRRADTPVVRRHARGLGPRNRSAAKVTASGASPRKPAQTDVRTARSGDQSRYLYGLAALAVARSVTGARGAREAVAKAPAATGGSEIPEPKVLCPAQRE